MPRKTSDAKVLDFNRPETAAPVGGELEVTAQSLVSRLALSTVGDLHSLNQAVLDRQDIGGAIKRVEEFFAPFKDMAHKLHKALCDRETSILAPLRRLDTVKRAAIADFKLAQDRIREARERELAEQRRREDDARAAAEAASLEAAGEHAMAAAVLEEAIAAPDPVVVLQDETKQIDGLKFRTEWKWRFATDEARALQLIPREFLSIDPRKLTAFAKAMKGAGRVPGVVFYSEQLPVR